MVGNLFTNEELDSADCDTKCQKIQFPLSESEVLVPSLGFRYLWMAKMILLVSSIEKI